MSRNRTENNLLTIEEVAELLRVSQDTVYRMAAAGKIPGQKVGRCWRFRRSDICDRFPVAGMDQDQPGTKNIDTTDKPAKITSKLSPQLLDFIQTSPTAVAILDNELKYLGYSQRWALDYGFAEGSYVGKSHYDTFPETSSYWKDFHQRCLAGEAIRKDYDRFETRQGGFQWITWEMSPWRDSEGQIAGLVMHTQFVTRQKIAELELKECEERFKTLADNAPVMIWQSSAEKQFTWVNQGWTGFTGKALHEELGDGWTRRVHRDDLPLCLEKFIEAHKHRREFLCEFRVRRHDGVYRWVQNKGIPRFSHDGEFLGFIGTSLDIDDRRRNDARNRALINAIPDAILRVTSTGMVLDFHASDELPLPLAEDDFLGQLIQQIFPGDLVEKLMVTTQQAGITNKMQSFEYAWGATDTSTEDRDVEVRVVASGADEAILLFRNITVRKTAERELQHRAHELREALEASKRLTVDLARKSEELETSRQEAVQASKAKSNFLANMSHEIRTPMTAILGYADLLHDLAQTAEVTEAARTIRRNGDHLLHILNDILDLSKIEAGKFQIEHLVCSPVELLKDVEDLLRVRSDAKGIGLKIQQHGTLPAAIKTDPTRLRQILINLAGNAIKFTEVGEVSIAMRYEPNLGGLPLLTVEVRDTGIGMTADQLANVFEAFTQADSSMARRFGGTGLGLTISKRLAEALGGTIKVESVAGKGSVFTVTIAAIPVNATSKEGESVRPVQTTANQLQCNLLLAEDGPDNQRFISHILRKAGATVTIVENGQEAVAAALNFRNQIDGDCQKFDVILMDMQMPILDGYSATRQLRDEGYDGPIIALTAHAMSSDRQKCIDAGCNDYATKPIDRQQLVGMVAHYSQRTVAGVS